MNTTDGTSTEVIKIASYMYTVTKRITDTQHTFQKELVLSEKNFNLSFLPIVVMYHNHIKQTRNTEGLI